MSDEAEPQRLEDLRGVPALGLLWTRHWGHDAVTKEVFQ
jgi:hypothetical protein